jgi:hypothetical protein
MTINAHKKLAGYAKGGVVKKPPMSMGKVQGAMRPVPAAPPVPRGGMSKPMMGKGGSVKRKGC